MAQLYSVRKHFFRRVTAVFSLTAFLVTQHLSAGIGGTPVFSSPTAETSFAPLHFKEVRLPEKTGKIEEFFEGKSGRTVVLVQDAHTIPAAQQNIRRLIEYFQKQYGFRQIAVEGAASKLDPQIFQSFPDKEKLQGVMEEYMDRGELTGANAAAIFGNDSALFQGIEDWKLYEEGLGLYLAAMGESEKVLDDVKREASNLEDEKRKIYSKQLLEVDRVLQGFHDNHGDLSEALKTMGAALRPGKGSSVAAFLEEIESEKGYWGKDEKKLEEKYEQISGRFLEEFETYAQSVKESLFRNKEERELDRKSHELELLKKLAKLELSRKEWEEIKEKSQVTRHKSQETSNKKQDRWLETKLWPYHEAFYKNAEARDAAMYENLMSMSSPNVLIGDPFKIDSRFRGNNMNNILLVVGGFHTQGLTQRFKDAGVSYLLIRPEIENIPEKTSYQDQMHGNVSWKNYFQVENGHVSLYDAFVRAARDKLLGINKSPVTGHQSQENIKDAGDLAPGALVPLKLWRDQIIRDLAHEEKLSEAGDYTKFLDELGRDRSKKTDLSLLQSGFAKIDHFVNALRGLESKSQLTPENVLKLLAPAALQTQAGLVLARGNYLSAEIANGKGIPLMSVRSEARMDTGNPEEIARRLMEEFGVKVFKNQQEYEIDPQDLFQAGTGMDQSWGMHEMRSVEKGPVFTEWDAIPVRKLKNPIESFPEFKEKGSKSAGVYLGFIEGVDYPVAIKIFKPLEKKHFELIYAQIYDRLGIGPRFYGRIELANGQTGYAMQVVPGKEVTRLGSPPNADEHREIILRAEQAGLYPSVRISTPSGHLVVIDAGNTEVINQEDYDKFIQTMNQPPVSGSGILGANSLAELIEKQNAEKEALKQRKAEDKHWRKEYRPDWRGRSEARTEEKETEFEGALKEAVHSIQLEEGRVIENLTPPGFPHWINAFYEGQSLLKEARKYFLKNLNQKTASLVGLTGPALVLKTTAAEKYALGFSQDEKLAELGIEPVVLHGDDFRMDNIPLEKAPESIRNDFLAIQKKYRSLMELRAEIKKARDSQEKKTKESRKVLRALTREAAKLEQEVSREYEEFSKKMVDMGLRVYSLGDGKTGQFLDRNFDFEGLARLLLALKGKISREEDPQAFYSYAADGSSRQRHRIVVGEDGKVRYLFGLTYKIWAEVVEDEEGNPQFVFREKGKQEPLLAAEVSHTTEFFKRGMGIEAVEAKEGKGYRILFGTEGSFREKSYLDIVFEGPEKRPVLHYPYDELNPVTLTPGGLPVEVRVRHEPSPHKLYIMESLLIPLLKNPKNQQPFEYPQNFDDLIYLSANNWVRYTRAVRRAQEEELGRDLTSIEEIVDVRKRRHLLYEDLPIQEHQREARKVVTTHNSPETLFRLWRYNLLADPPIQKKIREYFRIEAGALEARLDLVLQKIIVQKIRNRQKILHPFVSTEGVVAAKVGDLVVKFDAEPGPDGKYEFRRLADFYKKDVQPAAGLSFLPSSIVDLSELGEVTDGPEENPRQIKLGKVLVQMGGMSLGEFLQWLDGEIEKAEAFGEKQQAGEFLHLADFLLRKSVEQDIQMAAEFGFVNRYPERNLAQKSIFALHGIALPFHASLTSLVSGPAAWKSYHPRSYYKVMRKENTDEKYRLPARFHEMFRKILRQGLPSKEEFKKEFLRSPSRGQYVSHAVDWEVAREILSELQSEVDAVQFARLKKQYGQLKLASTRERLLAWTYLVKEVMVYPSSAAREALDEIYQEISGTAGAEETKGGLKQLLDSLYTIEHQRFPDLRSPRSHEHQIFEQFYRFGLDVIARSEAREAWTIERTELEGKTDALLEEKITALSKLYDSQAQSGSIKFSDIVLRLRRGTVDTIFAARDKGGEILGVRTLSTQGFHVLAEMNRESNPELQILNKEGEGAAVGDILVIPSSRESGIGTALFREGLDYLQKNPRPGVRFHFAAINPGNEPSFRALHKAAVSLGLPVYLYKTALLKPIRRGRETVLRPSDRWHFLIDLFPDKEHSPAVFEILKNSTFRLSEDPSKAWNSLLRPEARNQALDSLRQALSDPDSSEGIIFQSAIKIAGLAREKSEGMDQDTMAAFEQVLTRLSLRGLALGASAFAIDRLVRDRPDWVRPETIAALEKIFAFKRKGASEEEMSFAHSFAALALAEIGKQGNSAAIKILEKQKAVESSFHSYSQSALEMIETRSKAVPELPEVPLKQVLFIDDISILEEKMAGEIVALALQKNIRIDRPKNHEAGLVHYLKTRPSNEPIGIALLGGKCHDCIFKQTSEILNSVDQGNDNTLTRVTFPMEAVTHSDVRTFEDKTGRRIPGGSNDLKWALPEHLAVSSTDRRLFSLLMEPAAHRWIYPANTQRWDIPIKASVKVVIAEDGKILRVLNSGGTKTVVLDFLISPEAHEAFKSQMVSQPVRSEARVPGERPGTKARYAPSARAEARAKRMGKDQIPILASSLAILREWSGRVTRMASSTEIMRVSREVSRSFTSPMSSQRVLTLSETTSILDSSRSTKTPTSVAVNPAAFLPALSLFSFMAILLQNGISSIGNGILTLLKALVNEGMAILTASSTQVNRNSTLERRASTSPKRSGRGATASAIRSIFLSMASSSAPTWLGVKFSSFIKGVLSKIRSGEILAGIRALVNIIINYFYSVYNSYPPQPNPARSETRSEKVQGVPASLVRYDPQILGALYAREAGDIDRRRFETLLSADLSNIADILVMKVQSMGRIFVPFSDVDDPEGGGRTVYLELEKPISLNDGTVIKVLKLKGRRISSDPSKKIGEHRGRGYSGVEMVIRNSRLKTKPVPPDPDQGFEFREADQEKKEMQTLGRREHFETDRFAGLHRENRRYRGRELYTLISGLTDMDRRLGYQLSPGEKWTLAVLNVDGSLAFPVDEKKVMRQTGRAGRELYDLGKIHPSLTLGNVGVLGRETFGLKGQAVVAELEDPRIVLRDLGNLRMARYEASTNNGIVSLMRIFYDLLSREHQTVKFENRQDLVLPLLQGFFHDFKESDASENYFRRMAADIRSPQFFDLFHTVIYDSAFNIALDGTDLTDRGEFSSRPYWILSRYLQAAGRKNLVLAYLRQAQDTSKRIDFRKRSLDKARQSLEEEIVSFKDKKGVIILHLKDMLRAHEYETLQKALSRAEESLSRRRSEMQKRDESDTAQAPADSVEVLEKLFLLKLLPNTKPDKFLDIRIAEDIQDSKIDSKTLQVLRKAKDASRPIRVLLVEYDYLMHGKKDQTLGLYVLDPERKDPQNPGLPVVVGTGVLARTDYYFKFPYYRVEQLYIPQEFQNESLMRRALSLLLLKGKVGMLNSGDLEMLSADAERMMNALGKDLRFKLTDYRGESQIPGILANSLSISAGPAQRRSSRSEARQVSGETEMSLRNDSTMTPTSVAVNSRLDSLLMPASKNESVTGRRIMPQNREPVNIINNKLLNDKYIIEDLAPRLVEAVVDRRQATLEEAEQVVVYVNYEGFEKLREVLREVWKERAREILSARILAGGAPSAQNDKIESISERVWNEEIEALIEGIRPEDAKTPEVGGVIGLILPTGLRNSFILNFIRALSRSNVHRVFVTGEGKGRDEMVRALQKEGIQPAPVKKISEIKGEEYPVPTGIFDGQTEIEKMVQNILPFGISMEGVGENNRALVEDYAQVLYAAALAQAAEILRTRPHLRGEELKKEIIAKLKRFQGFENILMPSGNGFMISGVVAETLLKIRSSQEFQRAA